MIAAALKGAVETRVKATLVLLASGLKYLTHADGKITLQGQVLKDSNFVNRLIQTLNLLK